MVGPFCSGSTIESPLSNSQPADFIGESALIGYPESPETPWAPMSGLLGGVIGGAMTAALCEGNDECRAALHPEEGGDDEK